MTVETIGFTGHRRMSKEHTDWAHLAVDEAVKRAASAGAWWFTSGGAPGMDLAFLGAAIMQRERKAAKMGVAPETKLYTYPSGTGNIFAAAPPSDGFLCRLVACAALPFPGFWDYYKEHGKESGMLIGQREKQLDIILQIDPDPRYDASKMHKRNRWIVDNHDVLIAVYDGRKTGGTLSTLKYARKVGKPILWLDPVKQQERWIKE